MYMSTTELPLWSWLIQKFYIIPGINKVSASNAVTYTIDANSQYLPLQDEEAVSMSVQLAWLLTYIIVWAIVIIPRSTVYYSAYFTGFFVGLFIILVESFYSSTISNISFTSNPIEPYVINTPHIMSIKKGTKIKDPNKYINFTPGQGDYKVLIDNKTSPQKNTNYGFLFQADKFIEESASGKIRESVNLEDFLQTRGEGGEKYRFNPSNQANIDYFSNRVNEEAWAAYYICIIILTWAIFITTSKWGGTTQLVWTLMAFLISVMAGVTVMFSANILAYNYILYVRKRLLILAISFAITSIFIINS